jgi:hypothetical protein
MMTPLTYSTPDYLDNYQVITRLSHRVADLFNQMEFSPFSAT